MREPRKGAPQCQTPKVLLKDLLVSGPAPPRSPASDVIEPSSGTDWSAPVREDVASRGGAGGSVVCRAAAVGPGSPPPLPRGVRPSPVWRIRATAGLGVVVQPTNVSAKPSFATGGSSRPSPGRGGKWRRRPEASGRRRCCSVGADPFAGSFSSPRLSSCCRPPGRASAPRPAPAAALCWTAVAGNCRRRAGGRCRAPCPPTPPACE